MAQSRGWSHKSPVIHVFLWITLECPEIPKGEEMLSVRDEGTLTAQPLKN